MRTRYRPGLRSKFVSHACVRLERAFTFSGLDVSSIRANVACLREITEKKKKNVISDKKYEYNRNAVFGKMYPLSVGAAFDLSLSFRRGNVFENCVNRLLLQCNYFDRSISFFKCYVFFLFLFDDYYFEN